MVSTVSESILGIASKARKGDKKYSHDSALDELSLEGEIRHMQISRS